MHEFYDISFLDEIGDEVAQSQIKAEPNITSESQINALENFRCSPPRSYFKQSNASMQEALNEILPESYNKYLNAYEALIKWKESKEINSFAEPVLLDYFRELSTKYKPSSLWCTYSKLKSTINSNHGINISRYSRVIAFLKKTADGFQSKKSKLFTAGDVNKFLMEAPDDKYLAMKTVLVFALAGACSERRSRIINLQIDQVKDNGKEIIVRVPDPKTKVAKAYVIDGQFTEIVRKYMKLRPKSASTDRFFLQLVNGKCTTHAIGHTKITSFPKEIAKFLKLPECDAYTGNLFRIISKTSFDDTGVGTEIRMRYGQLKSSNVGEGNVQESLGHNSPSRSNSIIPIKQEEIIDDPLFWSQRLAINDISDNSSSSENEDASPQEALKETLPESYSKYLIAYEALIKWQESKEINSFTEPVLLDYFRELSMKYKPSTLWSIYSMLKSTINSNHGINMSEYSRLLEFLRNKADGFQSKMSKLLTADDVNKFLMEAPDDTYLAMKTILVFALIGACSGHKIANVKIDQVKDNGNEIIVRIPDPNTKVAKAYVIDGQFAKIVQKYMKLRPITTTTERFFTHYRDGKCSDRPVGRHHVAKVPKEVAKFLKLPESEAYNGNSFRIMSKLNFDDAGVGIETQEGNVQESLGRKRKMDTHIAVDINSSSTSNDIIPSHENAPKQIATDTITSYESCLIKQEEAIDDPLSLPEGVATTEMSYNNSSSVSKVIGKASFFGGNMQESLGHKTNIGTLIAEDINSQSTSNDIFSSHENASERIATGTYPESCSIKQEEINDDHLSLSERVGTTDDPLLCSQRKATTDMSDNNSSSESEAPRRKRKKRPKRQKEELFYWYDEECLSQTKLTTDMFKRFSKLDEGDKKKMLSEFSMHRVELFQKYFPAIKSTNTPATASSINAAATNGGMTDV